MLVGLSTINFALDGARVVRQDPEQDMENRSGSRRASRTPTLDGGASISDSGYSPADRILEVRTGHEHLDWIEDLVKLHPTIRISTRYGLFRGTPRRWEVDGEHAVLEIMVKEQESEIY